MSNDTILYDKDHYGMILNDQKHDTHCHLEGHIVLCNTPIYVKVGNTVLHTRGVFIRSLVSHEVDYSHEKVLVVRIDPTSNFYSSLEKNYLLDADCMEIPDYIIEEALPRLNDETLHLMREVFYRFICSNSDPCDNCIIDPRVRLSLKLINEDDCLDCHILDKILEEVNLSKSRFLHLFKSNLGFSFKSYILMKRIEKGFIMAVEKDSTMTEAAVEAGFSSGNHFSYVFKKRFGVNYRDFVKKMGGDK